MVLIYIFLCVLMLVHNHMHFCDCKHTYLIVWECYTRRHACTPKHIDVPVCMKALEFMPVYLCVFVCILVCI